MKRRNLFIAAAVAILAIALFFLRPDADKELTRQHRDPDSWGQQDRASRPPRGRQMPGQRGDDTMDWAQDSPDDEVVDGASTFRGTVEDALTHKPVAGALVQISGSWGADNTLGEAKTGRDGTFAITVEDVPRRALARVSAQGYSSTFDRLSAGEEETILLIQGITILGTVVKAGDGAGISNATVSCPQEFGLRNEPPSTTSAANGDFLLSGCKAGAVELIAQHRNYGTASQTLSERVAGEEASGVTIRMAPGVKVIGQLLEADATPVTHAHVLLYAQASQNDSDRGRRRWGRGRNFRKLQGRTTPDAEGNYTIGPLSAGDWELVAAQPDGRVIIEQFSVSGTRSMALDLTFPERLKIVGTVRTRDGPVGGTELELQNAQGRWSDPGRLYAARLYGRNAFSGRKINSRSDGSFEFTNVQPGSYRITARDSASGSATAECSAGDTNVVIELEPAGTIHVRVMRQGSQAQTGGRIMAIPEQGGWQDAHMAPLAGGEVTLRGVPEGTYNVRGFADVAGAARLATKEVEVRAGEVTEVTWELHDEIADPMATIIGPAAPKAYFARLPSKFAKKRRVNKKPGV